MTPAEQLIRNAEAKGAKIEFSESKLGLRMIGIRFARQYTYHWYHEWDDGSIFFDHSYSMITGRTHRGCSHRMRINSSLGYYEIGK